jgi:ATP synthase assembly factor FMC1, mitochondrial
MNNYTRFYKKLIKAAINHNKENKKKQLQKVIYKDLVKALYKDKSKMSTAGFKLPSIDDIKVDDKDKRLFVIEDTKMFKQLYKEFISSTNTQSIVTNDEIIQNISDFLKNQVEYQTLLERYNPGIKLEKQYGSNDYNKKIVERTAAKVGYKVPEFKPKEL